MNRSVVEPCTRSTNRRRAETCLRAAGTIAAATAIVAGLGVPPATAQNSNYFVETDYVRVHSGCNKTSPTVRVMPPNVAVTGIVSWEYGPPVNGIAVYWRFADGACISSAWDTSSFRSEADIWNKYSIPRTGVAPIQGGEVCIQGNCGPVTSGTPPRTPVSPGQAAVNWARAQKGKVFADAADAGRFAASDWAPGPFGELSGDCAKFPALALGHATGNYRMVTTGNAYDQYLYYRDRGMVRTGVPNVAGAIVFYKVAMPFGHTALATGSGGNIITTRGMDGDRLPVQEMHYSSFSNYLGYVVLT
jgi:hypothetical protein